MLARALHALTTGYFTAPRAIMMGGDPAPDEPGSLRMPYLCFAIELEDRSVIVVDGGVNHERSGVASTLLALISRGLTPAEWSLARRLAELGLVPARVRAAVVTHLDMDHTAGLPTLAARPVYVHRPEWRHAQAQGLMERLSGRQPLAPLRALTDVREYDCAERGEYPFSAGAFDPPEAEGAVTLVSLPGHTAGHVGVLVRIEGGGRVLLCGDACYDARQITHARPFGLFPRRVAVDLDRAELSLDRLRRWHKAEPELRIVPSHDAATGVLCEAGPRRLGAVAATEPSPGETAPSSPAAR